jgi:hypothetical protein
LPYLLGEPPALQLAGGLKIIVQDRLRSMDSKSSSVQFQDVARQLEMECPVHSYEFSPLPGIREFFEEARNSGRNVTLHVDDTRKVEIPECDMLFVDSLHVYEQVQKELELHAHKARQYIGFHDTTSFEHNGEFGGRGIWPAVQEFIDSHPEWQMIERRINNNGLTVLKRV